MLNLLTVANNAPRKNLNLCYGAARILKNRKVPFRWTFVGPLDINRVWLQCELGRNHIELVSWAHDLRPFYWAADLFVLPSEDEGFGMVFLESILCGTPVLCKADGGVGHLLDLLGGGGKEMIFESAADVASAIELTWVADIQPGRPLVTGSVLEKALTVFDRQALKLSWMKVLYG